MKWAIILLLSPNLQIVLSERYPSAQACGDALLVVAQEFDRKCAAVSPLPKPSPFGKGPENE